MVENWHSSRGSSPLHEGQNAIAEHQYLFYAEKKCIYVFALPLMNLLNVMILLSASFLLTTELQLF